MIDKRMLCLPPVTRIHKVACSVLSSEVLCGEQKGQDPGELKTEWEECTEVSESDCMADQTVGNGRSHAPNAVSQHSADAATSPLVTSPVALSSTR
jgi:hypothetical protein